MNGSASAAKSRVRRRDVRATPTRWSRTSRLTCAARSRPRHRTRSARLQAGDRSGACVAAGVPWRRPGDSDVRFELV